ncbi:MAG: hypothetical protein ABIZ49_12360, partial [Opitutaceae bacterium]
RRPLIIVIILALLALIALLFARCSKPEPTVAPPPATANAPGTSTPNAQPAAPAPGGAEVPEVLTPATVHAPPQIGAGAVFSVAWTGPNNTGDFVTIVRQETPATGNGAYALTREGSPLNLTAPIDPGEWELRYVTARSRTVLSRAKIFVLAAGATLDAAASITLDTPFSVTWTGPNNVGDFITVVAQSAPDSQNGNYALTNKGSPLTLVAPTSAGDAELRYVTGQDHKVLARRQVRVVTPEVNLSAPTEGIAGAAIAVTWTGPANDGDYITAVARATPDGQYGNYTLVNLGSPLKVILPINPGDAELRYMTGRGAKVLARRAIRIVAAEVSLSAPATVAAGTSIAVVWMGPNNVNDYITIVAKGTPDAEYGSYATTTKGSPLTLTAPKTAGEAELRYVSGQGRKVLARRSIAIAP